MHSRCQIIIGEAGGVIRPFRFGAVFILKKNGKTRPLGIPVMKCRAMQAYI